MSPKYIIAALVAVLGACTTADGSMVILQNQVPKDGCVIGAKVEPEFRARGRILADADVGYFFTPVVKSLIKATPDLARRIYVQGADIEVEDLEGNTLAEFGQRFSGSIEAGGTGGFGFEIVPVSVISSVRDGVVVANISIYGIVEGGGVDSDVFSYPVEICTDCFNVDIGPCDSLAEGYVGVTSGSSCNPQQDGEVECCSDGASLICPAEGPEPAEPPPA